MLSLSLLAFINIMELIYGWGHRSPRNLATDAAEAARIEARLNLSSVNMKRLSSGSKSRSKETPIFPPRTGS